MPGDLVFYSRFPTSSVSRASDLACLTVFCVFRWVQSPATSGFSSGGGGSRHTSPSLSTRNGDGGSGTRSASFVQIPSQRSPASSGFTLKPSTAGGVASPSPPPFVHSQQQQQPSSNRMVRSTGSMPSAPLQRNTPSPTVQYPSGSAGIILHNTYTP